MSVRPTPARKNGDHPAVGAETEYAGTTIGFPGGLTLFEILVGIDVHADSAHKVISHATAPGDVRFSDPTPIWSATRQHGRHSRQTYPARRWLRERNQPAERKHAAKPGRRPGNVEAREKSLMIRVGLIDDAVREQRDGGL